MASSSATGGSASGVQASGTGDGGTGSGGGGPSGNAGGGPSGSGGGGSGSHDGDPPSGTGYNGSLEEATSDSDDIVIVLSQAQAENSSSRKGKEVVTPKSNTRSKSLLAYFNSSRNSLNPGPLEHIPAPVPNQGSQRLSQTMADLFRRRRAKPRPREVPLRIGSPRRDEGGSPTRMPTLPGHASRKGKEKVVEKQNSKRKGKENIIPEDLPIPAPMDVDIDEGAQVFVNCSDEETLIVVSADEVLDEETEVMAPLPNPVLRRRQYEASRRFQETWAARLPWAEMVVGGNGNICQVKCIICSTMMGRVKLLLPKWDTLTKHAGRRRADRDIPGVANRGEYYYSRDCAHAKNAVLYASRGPQTVAQMAQNEAGERSRKRVQFATIFHILAQGRPMLEYESLNLLFNFLQVRHLPKKHWSDNSGWAMADVMYALVKAKLQETLTAARYFAITVDEVTSVDNQSWMSIHIYVMKDWIRQPYLLGLKCVTDGGSASNLTEVIVEAMKTDGGISRRTVAEKFVSFGADGVSVFQGSRTGVTRRLKDDHAPWMHGNHCMSHRFQLAIMILSKMGVVSNVEDLLGGLYGYFSHSPKCHNEFVKLATVMNKSHDKILRQVKTRWISMLKPAKRVLAQYDTLLYKMHLDAPTVKAAGPNLQMLSDVETVLALTCLMPLLETLNGVIKFSQGRNIFMCDFVGAIGQCQIELFQNYCDHNLAFTSSAFSEFKQLLAFTHESIKFVVKEDLNSGEGQLVFVVGGAYVWAKHRSSLTGAYDFVSEAKWEEIVGNVKAACKSKFMNALFCCMFCLSHLFLSSHIC